ncbi:helicase POLQ-like isoform X2 [Artemia franciscana]|uniref:Helicase POLQ-like n=1 Tax=Artemia franciscana TaxID=6661 RepID=A0AA88I4V4_ARTSF|nr:hypothetical protein QYM36_003992 [Artemia franciscana]
MDDAEDYLFTDELLGVLEPAAIGLSGNDVARKESQDLFDRTSPTSPVLSNRPAALKRRSCFHLSPTQIRSPQRRSLRKRPAVDADSLFVKPISRRSLESQNLFGDTQLTAATNARFGKSVSGLTLPRGSSSASLGNASILGSNLEGENKSPAFPILTHYTDVGPFFGLPEKVQELLKQQKGIDKLYDWQEECLRMALESPFSNLLYTLPTSGGKTLVAEILMMREILCRRRNCLFVLPYVALVQEKVRSFSPFAVALNFIVEEYAASQGIIPPKHRRKRRTIYISTIERANGIVNSLIEEKRLEEIGLVVVDEIHMISDRGRGPKLESLIIKLKAAQVDVRLVGMTATIGNLEELSKFLQGNIYRGDFRPVELKYTDAQKRHDPDAFGILVAEVVPKQNCLVFCATKRNAECVADLLLHVLPRSLLSHKKAEKKALVEALILEAGEICHILKKTIPFGISYHHSGLTVDERKLIEEAYLAGVLCCLCCTSTLAAGVNLPARRVIIRAPYIGKELISKARYQQMSGRAGRAGLSDCGEAILVISHSELENVKSLLRSPIENCVSRLMDEEAKVLKYLLLSAVSLGLAKNTREIMHNVMSQTLLKVQAKEMEVDIESLAISVTKTLISYGLIRQKQPGESSQLASTQHPLLYGDESLIGLTPLSQRSSSTLSNQSRSRSFGSQPEGVYLDKPIDLDLDCQLVVSRLGKAAIRGSVDLDKVVAVYQDLRKAQSGLVLVSRLHLMYLSTPYEQVNDGPFKISSAQYLKMFNRLSPEECCVAKSLGISEIVLIKLNSGLKPKVNHFTLKRFYLALMLHALWQGESIWDVADAFDSDRGHVQNLLQSAASFAISLKSFSEEFDEFWAFVDLFESFGRQLSLCCTAELIPLMELPSVKRGRAKQLFRAGFRSLSDVANASPEILTRRIDNLPKRVAVQIVAAAKMLITEKAEALQEEAEEILLRLRGA